MKKFAIILSALIVLTSCAGKRKDMSLIHSEEEISGLTLATVSGSCYALDLAEREDINLVLFNTPSDALYALKGKKADILIHDETTYNAKILRDYGVKIAFRGNNLFPTAFVFRKEDASLVDSMNATQERLIREGTMDRLKDYWLTDKYLEDETYTHIDGETTGEPIRVACALNLAPITFMVEDEWYGLEIDILLEFAKDLHRPLEIKLYDGPSSMMTLSSGMADMMAGCFFITPERQETFLFSEPYHSFRSAYYIVDPEAEGGATFWDKAKSSFEKNLIKENRWKYITSGLLETILISILSILLGSILGAGLYAMGRSKRKWARKTADIYNAFMAGIPMLVLLLIMFYVVFAKTGISPTLVAVIAFGLNFASSASGVYGTSLDAIPYGQTEAGLALGFTKLQTFVNIILPQALKRGLPLFKSQCISLVKGTSIVGYIAIQDLTRASDMIRSRTFDALLPLLVVTVLYFILAWLLGLLLKLAEPKKNVL